MEQVEMYSIFAGITSKFSNPTFSHGTGKTNWKYRGQLTPKNKIMESEVHIKSIEAESDGSMVVIADGFLFVDSLRVYAVEELRIRVSESEAPVSLAPDSSSVLMTPPPARVSRPRTNAGTPPSAGEIKKVLVDTLQPFYATVNADGKLADVTTAYCEANDRTIFVPAYNYADLGDASFLSTYGCQLPLYTGAMAKGIASAELVIAAGKAGILASLGAGGLPLGKVEEALDQIQAALPSGPYAVNLIHSPFDDHLEKGCVDILLRRGVRTVEASAFMKLTPHVVRYRVAGLAQGSDGRVICRNRIIFKVSRTELAEMALRPPPAAMVEKLLRNGDITAEQAALAKRVPMCDDVAVESDSGGHTDNRPLHVILPLIMRLRDKIQKEMGYPPHLHVRVGAGGGIGCPEAVVAAFSMGAAFIVTGTVNQMARESGSSTYVRRVLSKATYSDVVMAPAADMFDQGVELQVLKKGTLFPSRAKKLYQLFSLYDSLEEIPAKEMAKLEKRVFQKSVGEVWQETRNFYINRLHDPEKVDRAENHDPKLKMSMTFRWYLSKSSGWANRGDEGRERDYQIWCGPAIGSFNEFIKGTYLDPEVSRSFPGVVQINRQLLKGACYLRRAAHLLDNKYVNMDLTDLRQYSPEAEL